MVVLLQPRHQLFHRRPHRLVRDLLVEVLQPQLLRPDLDLIGQRLLQLLRHPQHPRQPAFSRDELLAHHVEPADPQEPRRLQPAPHRPRQRRERHPARRHPRILPVHDHHPVQLPRLLRQNRHDAFEAPARRHRVLHQRIGVKPLHRLVRRLIDELVHALPLSLHGVDRVALRHRLVRPRRVDLVGRLPVQPVVGPAQPQPLRADDAHVVRRVRLAQRARVEDVHALVRHPRHPRVPRRPHLPRLFQQRRHLLFVRVDRHLHLVHQRREVLHVERPQQLPEVLQPQTRAESVLRYPHPAHVPLTHVEYAHRMVDQRVNLPLENRLEVLLHLPPGHLDVQPERHRAPQLHRIAVRTDQLDLPVLNAVQRPHPQELEGRRVLAAKLHLHVIPANRLPLERRRHGHRNVDLRDAHLHPAHLDARLDDALVVQLPHQRLVRRHPRRPDLRNLRIADHRETHGDRPGPARKLQVIDIAEPQPKGEDP